VASNRSSGPASCDIEPTASTGSWVSPGRRLAGPASWGFFLFNGLGVKAGRNQDASIEQTLAVWQPRTKRTLSHEDAREITANITGFFRVLHDWADKDWLMSTTCEPSSAKVPPLAAGAKHNVEEEKTAR
jgi:hypothetical protein